MLGRLSVPLFISFLPKEEFIAFEPSLIPRLAKLSAIPFLVSLSLLLSFFYKAIAGGLNLAFFLPNIFLSRFASLRGIIP